MLLLLVGNAVAGAVWYKIQADSLEVTGKTGQTDAKPTLETSSKAISSSEQVTTTASLITVSTSDAFTTTSIASPTAIPKAALVGLPYDSIQLPRRNRHRLRTKIAWDGAPDSLFAKLLQKFSFKKRPPPPNEPNFYENLLKNIDAVKPRLVDSTEHLPDIHKDVETHSEEMPQFTGTGSTLESIPTRKFIQRPFPSSDQNLDQ